MGWKMTAAYTGNITITKDLMDRFKRIHDMRVDTFSAISESKKLGEVRVPKTNTWLYVLSLGCAAAEAELGMDAGK